ncbi:MAG: hypothetical protein AB1Z19_08630 [Eubacteriales bacterium]
MIALTQKEFYESTPAELHMRAEGKIEAMMQNAELEAYVTSVGVNNVLNKKKIKLFDKNKDETKASTKERREADLKYLTDKFGG